MFQFSFYKLHVSYFLLLIIYNYYDSKLINVNAKNYKMNLDSLLTTLDSCGNFGLIISTEESIILHNSLLLLKNENHFRKIYFWGKIQGVEKDYYIAYGYTKDILLNRVFYYSTNCIDWALLPNTTDHFRTLTILCTTKFQGDPALVTDVLIEKDERDFFEKLTGAKLLKLKEENRLAATVWLINFEAAAIPRGALFKRADGVTVENLSYEGLTALEAQEIKNFLHFRDPQSTWNTNLLTRCDYNLALDFLDTIDVEIPKGCFTLNHYGGGTIAVVESLYWPGMFTYHYINTAIYGMVYFGNGKRNLDVPFMLHPL